MLIVACASLFSFVCTRFGISTAASELLARVAGNQFTFLLICNIIFLIAGCFIDANSAMYIFIPAAIENDETVGGDSGTTQTDNDDFNTIGDYSDLDWADMTWNFTCSTTETSTWAQAGRKFGELMEQATGGKVKVDVYAADQLTGGNQSEGIQAQQPDLFGI